MMIGKTSFVLDVFGNGRIWRAEVFGYSIGILFLLIHGYALATPADSTPAIKVLRGILSQPDVDVATAKLTIDQLVDPSIDANKVRSEIDEMLGDLESGLDPNLMPLDKVLSLAAFLHEAGYWNNQQPFRYDFSDPLGENIETKLLSNYLATKKGNCISMPILFAILANKLGLDVTLSTAPLHVFVKFKDPATGRYINIETTDRAQVVPDQFYFDKSAISKLALESKTYLQPLTRKQSIAVMATVLVEHYERQGNWRASIEVAQLILQYYPNYAYAMIKIGNGYFMLLSEQVAIVKERGTYTPAEKEYADQLYQQNLTWFRKAEELGWRAVSPEENAAYVSDLEKNSKTAIQR